jgi:hypothetical protein
MEVLEDRAVPAFPAPASYATGLNPAGVTSGDSNGDATPTSPSSTRPRWGP